MRKTLIFLALCTGACSAPTEAVAEEGGATASVFVDTDGDGLPDAKMPEAAYIDSDGDGLPDKRVVPTDRFVDTNNDGIPDTRVYK